MAGDTATRGEPQRPARPLHGVRAVDAQIGDLGGERLDGRRRLLRLQETAGQRVDLEHDGRRHAAQVATVKNDSGSGAPYQTTARPMSSPFQITGCHSGSWIA